MAPENVPNASHTQLDYLGHPCAFAEAASRYDQPFDDCIRAARTRSVREIKRVVARGLNELIERDETAGNLLEAAEATLPNSTDDDKSRAVIAAAQAYARDSANKLFVLGAEIVAAIEKLEAFEAENKEASHV